MKNLLGLDITIFKNSVLVRPEGRGLAQKWFDEGKDPVLPLIARGLVKERGFFSEIARLFGLPYHSRLPVPVSASRVLSLRIPLSLSVKYQLYFFEEEGRVYCASATPYIPSTAFAELAAFIDRPSVCIVIAPISEIRRVIAHVYHYDTSVTATDRMEVVLPESSSKLYRNLFLPYIFPIGFLIVFALWAAWDLSNALLSVFLVLNALYFLLNPYKIYVFFRSFNPTKLISIPPDDIERFREDEAPIYTILLPVKNEATIVSRLVKNILALDYPPEKLDIKLVCEVSDTTTLEALAKEGIGEATDAATALSAMVELIKVPVEKLSTKPRSCNYAVQFARGAYVVIYDAEDQPEPDQLKKSVLAFKRAPLNTICAQAKLNFYNRRYNTLTRLFSLEYSFWYDFFLPGNQEMNSAITLGGTSNHFVAPYLKKVGYWDPYNVTEDADLGLRIFRYRLTTVVFNSYTLEEANSQLGNWLRQRTRWEKGFLMTLLVNLRHPLRASAEIGWWRYLQSLFSVASNFFLPLFNPVLWIVFAASFLPLLPSLALSVPSLPLKAIGLFNLIVGNLTYLIVNAIVVIKKRQLDLVPFVLLLPAYWMLLSIACWRAVWQFVRDPYRWEKTRHGIAN